MKNWLFLAVAAFSWISLINSTETCAVNDNDAQCEQEGRCPCEDD